MPKAVRKPSNAQESFALPGWVQKCGVATLVIGVIIGVSHYFSPAEDPEGAAPQKSGTSAVTALDDSNFDKFLASHPDGALVDFFTKDCKFCAKLAPEFEKAAKELSASGGPPLASVDAETGPEVMQKLGMQRYPTVYWFWKGENVLEFPRASEKTAAKIVEWSRWAASPAVQELETRAEFDEALATLRSSLHSKARLMVAFHREGMRDALEAAAQRHRATTVFLYIKEGNPDEPRMKSYGQEESKDENYEGSATPAEVTEWVKGILEKAKPAEAEAKAEEPKTAATKAIEQVQKALENAEAAKGEANAE